jgi:uncharacterized protein YecT (DUF1311 family)
MSDRELIGDEDPVPRRTNWTIIALLAGLALVALMAAYFSTRGNQDQDKLTNSTVATGSPRPTNREKLCASSATYDLIKRELFRRASQLRGSDEAAFDRLSSVAVVRMDNPVMESQDTSTGAVNCSGSLSLDLPPGVQVVGGRRTLSSEVDYTVTMAADGSGPVVLLKNADAIVTPLATIAQVVPQQGGEPQQAPETDEGTQGEGNPGQAGSGQGAQAPAVPQSQQPAAPRPQTARPSFDCASARTRGEVAVCNEAGLAALDRQMAAQYSRAFAVASPEERQILRQTAQRFYAYRDRCTTNACIGDAYTGRMREIRDIMEGRWEPSQ